MVPAAGKSWQRLIPARAGNTLESYELDMLSAAHPRSRGEHDESEAWIRSAVGSSPLARGTRYHLSCRDQSRRLIPARAGNTTSS